MLQLFDSTALAKAKDDVKPTPQSAILGLGIAARKEQQKLGLTTKTPKEPFRGAPAESGSGGGHGDDKATGGKRRTHTRKPK